MRNKRAKLIRKIAVAKAAEARKKKIPFYFKNYYRRLKRVWTKLPVTQKNAA